MKFDGSNCNMTIHLSPRVATDPSKAIFEAEDKMVDSDGECNLLLCPHSPMIHVMMGDHVVDNQAVAEALSKASAEGGDAIDRVRTQIRRIRCDGRAVAFNGVESSPSTSVSLLEAIEELRNPPLSCQVPPLLTPLATAPKTFILHADLEIAAEAGGRDYGSAMLNSLLNGARSTKGALDGVQVYGQTLPPYGPRGAHASIVGPASSTKPGPDGRIPDGPAREAERKLRRAAPGETVPVARVTRPKAKINAPGLTSLAVAKADQLGDTIPSKGGKAAFRENPIPTAQQSPMKPNDATDNKIAVVGLTETVAPAPTPATGALGEQLRVQNPPAQDGQPAATVPAVPVPKTGDLASPTENKSTTNGGDT